MAEGHFLRDLDFSDRDFHQIALARAFQAQCDIHELVLATKQTIAETKALMAESDRMLARL